MTSSCQPLVDASVHPNRTREVRLRTGLGHGFLYRPLPEWVDPVAAFAGDVRE